MGSHLHHFVFVALVVSLVSLAYGLNYMYFSDVETTVFGEHIYFWHGDTLSLIRSNECIYPMQGPPVVDSSEFTIMSCDSGWTPSYHLIVNAPRLPFPDHAEWIREQATAQGHYFNEGDTMMARVHIEGDSLKIWWTGQNMPFDTNSFTYHSLPESAVVFFDAPIVHLWGTVSTTLIFGCAGRAGLEDNILYASSSEPNHGQIVPAHTEKFALVAEGEIKILNTYANGRNDSNFRGNNQIRHDSTDIYLNGLYFALGGSFTFEEQNDPDSGYVFQYPPGQNHIDDRGRVFLWGALAQRQRGYVHRTNNGSTGYLKDYHWDTSLKLWHVGVFSDTLRENQASPASLNFGTVNIGQVAWDTVTVSNDFVPVAIDGLDYVPPFVVEPVDSYRWEQRVPVTFAPVVPGEYHSSVRFWITEYQQWVTVPVNGTGVNPSDADARFAPPPSSLILSASPNPFNPTTEIEFSLPEAGPVKLEVFDVVGRYVMTLQNSFMAAGDHMAVLDGWKLSAGIHFARLSTSHRQATIKLLLIK